MVGWCTTYGARPVRLPTDSNGWMDAITWSLANTGEPLYNGCVNSNLHMGVWDTTTRGRVGPPDPNGHYVLWLEWMNSRRFDVP